MHQIGHRFGTAGLLFWGLLFLFAAPAAANPVQGIPVLLYHHVTDQKTDMPELSVSTAEFSRQLLLLRFHGFQTITVAQLGSFMRGERVALPKKPLLITFDDGYEDNYAQAFPILKDSGYLATIFMVGINFDRTNRLASSQVREMTSHGFSVGAHSMSHPDLTQSSVSALRYEVTASKKKAERVLRAEVGFFAYPGGYYNLTVVESVEAAGYEGAFSVLPGLNQPDRDNIYLMRRIPIFRTTNFDRLLDRLDAPLSKPSLLDY
jgi:peptidoglycan/xylan/chitin deacetylase (PgdA/CDA1 family)